MTKSCTAVLQYRIAHSTSFIMIVCATLTRTKAEQNALHLEERGTNSGTPLRYGWNAMSTRESGEPSVADLTKPALGKGLALATGTN